MLVPKREPEGAFAPAEPNREPDEAPVEAGAPKVKLDMAKHSSSAPVVDLSRLVFARSLPEILTKKNCQSDAIRIRCNVPNAKIVDACR